MHSITIMAGCGKSGTKEGFDAIELQNGELWTIVGNTGAGKSRLIKDVEQLAWGDSVTGRKILLDGARPEPEERQQAAFRLVAHLGQNMRFVLDTTVEEFLSLHARARGKNAPIQEVLTLTNDITPEPVTPGQNLNLLSGGQARALMIADIALIFDCPIVLIDEIENAGVDKEKAFSHLQGAEKLVLVVTHDPHTALMAPKRIVMEQGAVAAVVERTAAEETLYLFLWSFWFLNWAGSVSTVCFLPQH